MIKYLYSLLFILLSLFSSSSSTQKFILEVASYKDCTSQLSHHFQQSNFNYKHLEHINMMILESSTIINIDNIPFGRKCIKSIFENKKFFLEKPIKGITTESIYKGWHLKRINVQDPPLPNEYERRITHSKSVKTHVILIDSGIDGDHVELKDKLANKDEHFSFVEVDSCCMKDNDPLCDCLGFGTHSSGLVASKTAGYNENAILHSIKIFDENASSTLEIILSSMNEAITLKNNYFKNEATIASMSFAVVSNSLIDSAVYSMKKAGILVIVGAENDNDDACNYSPAGSTDAFTVGSSNINDNRSTYSNFGNCINIFAPGSNIYSTIPGNEYAFLYGTNTSTPIVSGFASAVAGSLGLTDPDEIRIAVLKNTVENKIKNSMSQNNFLPFDGKRSFDFLDN